MLPSVLLGENSNNAGYIGSLQEMKRCKTWASSINHGYYGEATYFQGRQYAFCRIRVGKAHSRLCQSSYDMDTPSVIIRLLEEAGPLKLTPLYAGMCSSLMGVYFSHTAIGGH